MSKKTAAVQAAATAVALAAVAINNYGRSSREAQGALRAARAAVTAARTAGATDADLRAASPQ
ncbi:hypothetical protein ACIQWV_38320 [Streptomyces sp. NPDC098085]|uniref:hypothetical protein n=1 Tax=Streptomyces sp. NPDC098085 TaxID=3366094 RepID=UPI00381A0C0F